MNFYDEIKKEAADTGIEINIIPVPEELIPTSNDYNELNENILKRTEKNRYMLYLSDIYASYNISCGDIKLTNYDEQKRLVKKTNNIKCRAK